MTKRLTTPVKETIEVVKEKKEVDILITITHMGISNKNDIHNTGVAGYEEDATTIIGKLTKMDLVPENEIKGISSAQIQKTPLVNFFEEAMLHYSKEADVVAFQIDTDTPSLDIREIKNKDIARNYQFTDREVTFYDITGKDLKDYMERGAYYYN